jgi:hypothetical protein
MAGNPLEDYLRELRDVRRSGSAVPETSYYPPLAALFNADLLDVELPVFGVTVGTLRSELREIGSITRDGGRSLNPDSGDLDVTAGWGHGGNASAVMPGKGKIIPRDYTAKEREAFTAGAAVLGLSEVQVLTLTARGVSGSG